MPKPGSRNTLTPKNVVYSRTTSSGTTQIVDSTVHVAPKKQHSINDKNQSKLPAEHRFTSFVSDKGRDNVQKFIKDNYGTGSENIKFNSTNKMYGIIGPGNTIKAAGEIKKLTWAMSELAHLTVHPDARGQGLGKSMLSYLEQQTTTPMSMITSKNPTVMRMANDMGFTKISDIAGPSNDKVSMYVKTLKPFE